MPRRTTSVSEGQLEKLPSVLESDSEGGFIDDLLDLCQQEVNYLLHLVGASATDRIIIRLYLAKVPDKVIAETLSASFGREYTTDAVKKRRYRLLYNISKKAGKALGWITVLREAFPGQINVF